MDNMETVQKDLKNKLLGRIDEVHDERSNCDRQHIMEGHVHASEICKQWFGPSYMNALSTEKNEQF